MAFPSSQIIPPAHTVINAPDYTHPLPASLLIQKQRILIIIVSSHYMYTLDLIHLTLRSSAALLILLAPTLSHRHTLTASPLKPNQLTKSHHRLHFVSIIHNHFFTSFESCSFSQQFLCARFRLDFSSLTRTKIIRAAITTCSPQSVSICHPKLKSAFSSPPVISKDTTFPFSIRCLSSPMSSSRRGTSVHIETDTPTFTSGSAITGKVVILRKKRLKKLQCILLKLEGGGIVSIIDHLEETPITSIQCCLNTSLPLAGEVNGSSSSPAVIIKPGRNEYKFSYNLPSSLPSTFYGKYGSTSYSLRALLLLRSKRIYASAQIPLIISGLLDLNNEPGARNSCHLQREAKVWSLAMCHHGKVKLHFTMPQQGYVPGQLLPFSALMSNFTFNYIKFTQISLVQVIFYIIQGKRKKTETRILVEKRGPRIEAGRALTWRGDDPKCDFKVPIDALPSRASPQSTIQIHYQLQIKIKESASRANREAAIIEAFLPLTIGTVPLEDILVPILRLKSPSPPPSPLEDFDFMDADDDDEDCTNDELTNDERSEASIGRSRASSTAERFPPPYATFTQEYFI